MSTLPKPAPARRANRFRTLVWGGAAGLLLLPAVAMHLDAPGVHWTGSDFLVMGLLLAAVCGLYEFATRRRAGTAWRAGFALALAAAFLTVSVNLAVGMLGGEGDPLNLLFVAVLLVAAVGALRAKFRARGMARAMALTALAQLVAALAGLGVGLASADGDAGRLSLLREIVLVAAFALPWGASALLFRRADARRHLVPHD
ncbi:MULTISPECIES: hypothetical protein [unclassified Luteimonas]|uniref:hypothetical protein n=1 Tax=unclassified Luteimonas TaxID=2629088 RepID=UPI0018F101D5|nr:MULTISPECIES: hypothetical protein [unclassified Luteimonas]MBJ6979405.1 hypothetical protein [Luteimonas sp. MC1895]MBJ6984380.1 hypothetical protein [Luteimonas sp. MC1750]QQO05000.1 hypothetical protein JGR68_08920 [Luteimonas sp. MC1750]